MEPHQDERTGSREIEGLLIELQKGIRAVGFYPPKHPALLKIVQQSYAPYQKAAHDNGEFSFSVTRAGIWYNEKVQSPENEAVKGLAKLLFQRRIKKLFFLDGLSIHEWYQFLRNVASEPDELYQRGGLEVLLKKSGIRHVFVNDIDLNYLKQPSAQQEIPQFEIPEEEQLPPEPEAPPEQTDEDTQTIAHSRELTSEGYDPDEDEDGAQFMQELEGRLAQLDKARGNPDIYYINAVALAELASRLLEARRWGMLFRLIEIFEQDSHNPDIAVDVKKYAIRAMRKIASPQVARALLTELLTDDKSETEVETLLRILSLFGTVTLDALGERIRTPVDDYGKNLVAQLLARIGHPAMPLIQSLVNGDTSPAVAEIAAFTLGAIKEPSGVPLLKTLLARKEPEILNAAIDALFSIRDLEALNVLGRYLSGDNPLPQRRRILDTAGNYKEFRLIPILLDLFRQAEDFELTPDLRKALNISLARIGGKAVHEALIDILKARKLFGPAFDHRTLSDALKIIAASGDRDALNHLRADVKFRDSDLQQQLLQTLERMERRLADTAGRLGERTDS